MTGGQRMDGIRGGMPSSLANACRASGSPTRTVRSAAPSTRTTGAMLASSDAATPTPPMSIIFISLSTT